MLNPKITPQTLEIEKAVLGALLIDNGCLSIGMLKLFPEIFYKESYSLIFQAIERIYDKGQNIDILTVVEQLKKDGTLEAAGGFYEITKVTQDVVSSANIENHILLLSEFYLKRQTINICSSAMNDSYNDEKDIFEVISHTDSDIQKIQERVISGAARDMSYFSAKMLQQHDEAKSTGIIGISTGIKAIDAAIAGLVAPDVIVIAARPGQGKTALALSITHNTSVLNDIPVLWISLEMDGVQLVRRLVSMDAGVNHEYIRAGKTSNDEYNNMLISIDRVSKSKIFIEDKTSINVRDIRTRANLLKKKHGIKYVIVDYIQLMHGIDKNNGNREQEIAEISRGLKCLAKELEIPVIVLSQLSRECEKRPDKMPQLSDLRESGAIEQDADEVIFLMRPEYYKMTEDVSIGGNEYSVRGLCICNIAKNRHGPTKNIAISFNGANMHFYDNNPGKEGFVATEMWKSIND